MRQGSNTRIASVLVARCCPTGQSDPLRSSCLLRLTPGTGGSSHPPQVRRPSHAHLACNPGTRWWLASSRISHNRPGVATRTSTPRSSTRLCFCVDIPPTIAATLTSGGERGTDGPPSLPLSEVVLRFCFWGSSSPAVAMS